MPSKRVIRAKDLIRDIRSGMTDAELVQRYKLSESQLYRLRQRLPEAGRIQIKEMVADVRSRATDFELCHKYDLVVDELPLVLEKLVDLGALREDELKERSAFYDEPSHRSRTRRLPRTRLTFELPVYDTDNPSRTGLARDISERGLRVASFTPDIAEAKRFTLRPEEFPNIRSFDLEVECKWINKKDLSTEYYQAGFEIIEISDNSRLEFGKLLRQLRTKDGQIATELWEPPKRDELKPRDTASAPKIQINREKKESEEPPIKREPPVEAASSNGVTPRFTENYANFSEELEHPINGIDLSTVSDEPLTLVDSLLGQKSVGSYPVRSLERSDLRDFHIPVFYKEKPEAVGLLIDITEEGLGISELKANIGEAKTLIIPASELTGGFPIELETTCRWVQGDTSEADFRGI